MQVLEYIQKRLLEETLHFSLLDPDKNKMSLDSVRKLVGTISDFGTDAIMVGGSTNIDHAYLDSFVKTIKEETKKPVILFPGGLNGLTKHADAIFFMSLMNSTDPYWIVNAQSKAAPFLKKLNIEPIPMAYLVVAPGMTVGKVGKAKVIKRTESKKAAEYALAAQYFGMKFVYLEAGSGAPVHVPVKMIKIVKEAVDIPVIVGGGIRTKEAAKAVAEAGADIIVTGTLLERSASKLESMIETIKRH
jgi:phosphoglycerol geranylgeranyltransferase